MARPELGYVPINKSEVYLKGYSLESLRDLELQPLPTQQAREGKYFDLTLRRLFKLVAHGCGMGGEQASLRNADQVRWPCKVPKTPSPWPRSTAACLTMPPCPCWARCSSPTPWQRVIKLLSLSKAARAGAVARAASATNCCPSTSWVPCTRPCSATGASLPTKTCTKSNPRPKGRAASEDDEGDDDADGGDDDSASTGRQARASDSDADMLEKPWSGPRSRIDDYKDDGKVYDVEDGRRKLRMHPKGEADGRLAAATGKSASYYTPQVLTQCSVKYALKELLDEKNGRVKRADDILTLTVRARHGQRRS